ncbi:MAG: hypothetical protein JNK05_33810 [Myxococcales bacterium]|nr:hypothetical protein [Myxococcales bacterium]
MSDTSPNQQLDRALYRGWLAMVLAIPLVAHAVGALVAWRFGLRTSAFIVGASVGAVGALASLVVASSKAVRKALSRAAPIVAAVCVGALFATLLAPGRDDVHRWLPLGPFSLHVSAALSPWILWAASTLLARRDALAYAAFALLFAAQGAHYLQPDTAQSWALAAGASMLLYASRIIAPIRYGTIAIMAAFALATSMRPTSLEPVPEVEGVLSLAESLGSGWWVGAVLCVAGFPFVLGRWAPSRLQSPTVHALAAYAGAIALSSFTGDYPVPWLGAGAGHMLGAYAMVALSLTKMRSDAVG